VERQEGDKEEKKIEKSIGFADLTALGVRTFAPNT